MDQREVFSFDPDLALASGQAPRSDYCTFRVTPCEFVVVLSVAVTVIGYDPGTVVRVRFTVADPILVESA